MNSNIKSWVPKYLLTPIMDKYESLFNILTFKALYFKDFHIRCNLPYSHIGLSMIAIPKTQNPFNTFY